MATINDRSTRQRLVDAGVGLADTHRRHVRSAYAYHVSENMTRMVQHAAAGLDDTDTFDRNLAPTAVGIARFEGGLPIMDVRGKRMIAHWVVWGPVTVNDRPCTLLTWYNDVATEADEVAVEHLQSEDGQKYRDIVGRWFWIGGDYIGQGVEIGGETVWPGDEQIAAIEAEGDVPHPSTSATRYAHALWLLLGQTTTSVTDADLDRTTRRRAGKAGLPPRVTVIALRRPESTGKSDGESMVEWQHSWLVRGHWRWQRRGPVAGDHVHAFPPVGSGVRPCLIDGCEARYERIFVRGYVKGPEDAPLKISDKVYALRR